MQSKYRSARGVSRSKGVRERQAITSIVLVSSEDLMWKEKLCPHVSSLGGPGAWSAAGARSSSKHVTRGNFFKRFKTREDLEYCRPLCLMPLFLIYIISRE
jgi:hypothetical protein